MPIDEEDWEFENLPYPEHMKQKSEQSNTKKYEYDEYSPYDAYGPMFGEYYSLEDAKSQWPGFPVRKRHVIMEATEWEDVDDETT